MCIGNFEFDRNRPAIKGAVPDILRELPLAVLHEYLSVCQSLPMLFYHLKAEHANRTPQTLTRTYVMIDHFIAAKF